MAIVEHGTGGVWSVRTTGGPTAGTTRNVSMRGRLKREREADLKLAVGDAVRLERTDHGDTWAIVEIMPRRSALARRAPGGRVGERVVAANLDQVVVVFAVANPEPHARMLDRFLVIAEANDLAARVVLNKADLADEATVRARWADYTRAGYPLHVTSTITGVGLPAFATTLAGRTSAVTGPSGVGKSSLLNTLYPGLSLRVGAISESVNKGRHTTVGAWLHALPDGGAVVDTPGLREVGIWGLDPGDLAPCFPEFRPFLGECRFGDCQHMREPGCAVRAAVAAHDVSTARYESYQTLHGELSAT